MRSLSDSSPSRDARSVMTEMRQQADHFLRVFVPSGDDAGAGAAHLHDQRRMQSS